MPILRINGNPGAMRDFVDFAYLHYQSDNDWIPSVRKIQYDAMEDPGVTYGAAKTDVQSFLAVYNGIVQGRITAFVNKALVGEDGQRVGTFGNFECVKDYAVAEDLFGHAIEWLRNVHGLDRVWGPLNYDIWHGYRWMTRGFNQPRVLGEPFNKSYYPDFAIRFGFGLKKQWEALDVIGREDIDTLTVPYKKHFNRLIDRGYRFEPVTKVTFERLVRKVYQVLTDSYAGFVGYTPVSFERFKRLFGTLRYALKGRLFCLVYDADGQLAGLTGAFLDLSNAVRAMAGQSHVLGKVRFKRRLRRANHVIYYVIGATHKTMRRNVGIGCAVIHHFGETMRSLGLDTATVGPMPSDGISRKLALGDQFPAQRTYGLYEIDT